VDTVAVTRLGAIRGFARGGALVFKGIRFGRAERFRPALPVSGWEGELDASTYGPQCHQVPGLMERALGASSLPMSEDCLFLNVFTPAVDDAARPVLVWVHGGAYTAGSGSMPWYEGTHLATMGDVVVVTLNYRLGAFGFAGRNNLGSLDQVLALQWVHDHIAAFGGDPGNVTVFGESAGGSSLVALMAMPATQGLFHRALAMSPSISQLRSGLRADEALAEFLAAAGAASLDELVDAPVERILAAQAERLNDAVAGFSGFSPTSDGDGVPGSILERAAADPRPLVLGTCRDEAALWNAFAPQLDGLSEEALVTGVRRRLGDRAETAVAAYRSARPGSTLIDVLTAVMTDEVFRAPARRLAEQRVARRHATWMYWFTWASTAFDGKLGSCHAIDIPFAFHNLSRPGVEMFTGDGDDRAGVADVMSSAVLSFAVTGAAPWPEYDLDTRPVQRIDVTPELLHDPEAELRALWS
jgi:para-nitrobenzyl esterase